MPRPETELTAQLAIDALRAAASPTPVAVDLGTGSGAIALAIATEVPHAEVHAAENSPEAYTWARQNAARIGAANATIAFVDLARAFPELDGTVSVVVSNPPYVPDAAIPRDRRCGCSIRPRRSTAVRTVWMSSDRSAARACASRMRGRSS